MTANNKGKLYEIINGEVPVLVDFTAVWCSLQMMKPVLEELHTQRRYFRIH